MDKLFFVCTNIKSFNIFVKEKFYLSLVKFICTLYKQETKSVTYFGKLEIHIHISHESFFIILVRLFMSPHVWEPVKFITQL